MRRGLGKELEEVHEEVDGVVLDVGVVGGAGGGIDDEEEEGTGVGRGGSTVDGVALHEEDG